ncbi:glycoside hydrolase family 18 protein [Sphaerimonospora thailandensis]|nr:cellulose binding domain-containing protein [Sphaerimonospora thailandensis]
MLLGSLLAGAALLAPLALGTASAATSATATYSTDSDWGSGFQGRYTITAGSAALPSWTVEFDAPAGITISSAWDATMTRSGSHYTFTKPSWAGPLAAGASTGFGLMGAPGGFKPLNCKLNGAPCGGGSNPSPSPSPSPSATPTRSPSPSPSPSATPTRSPSPSPSATPTAPPQPAGVPVAPYVDMGAWPTPSLTEMAAGGNVSSFTMAFVTGAACKASWFGAYDPRTGWAKDQVDAIRAAGGDVKVSFGGASGVELAQGCGSLSSLVAEYQAVVTAYDLKYIDLDIEGAAAADRVSVDRRSQALAQLQKANPGLRVSLTLPVLPEGLTADGVYIVKSARDAGVALDMVNVMAMDYYRNGDYGDFAVQAAQSTFNQIKSLYPGYSDAQLWRMVGVTPMIGANDDQRIFDQADARQLVAFAQGKHLGMLSFWEMVRDRNACTGPLFKCTNIPQQPYDFSKIFAGYRG